MHETIFFVCSYLHNKFIVLEDRAPLMGKKKKVLREILIIGVDKPRRMHKFHQAVFARVKQAMWIYVGNQESSLEVGYLQMDNFVCQIAERVLPVLQAEFTAMRDQYMRGGEGFIICYSITDRQSFQEAAEFKELIYRVRHTYDIPVVLVGNKIDLEEFRQVSNFSAGFGWIFLGCLRGFCSICCTVLLRIISTGRNLIKVWQTCNELKSLWCFSFICCESWISLGKSYLNFLVLLEKLWLLLSKDL